MTDVAAVIGNFQGEKLLPDCLASLRLQTQQPSEVIVVDGSSTDASVAVADREGARVVSAPNRGLGFLYNRGVEATAAPYVLLLNNDVALEPDCLRSLAAALDARPTAFAADAHQLDWSGDRTIHAGTTLAPGRLVGEYLPGLHLESTVSADDTVSTVCANGAAMLVRRDRHLELGGFDESFFMEWEDLDLCWRAWARGWRTVYVPAAVVRHRVGAATAGSLAGRRAASSHHNMLRFAIKCLPAGAVGRLVAGELLRCPRYPAAIGSAFVQVTKELPEILRLRRAMRPNAVLYRMVVEGRLEEAATLRPS
jgi:GT2 family glycosyltransferase